MKNISLIRRIAALALLSALLSVPLSGLCEPAVTQVLTGESGCNLRAVPSGVDDRDILTSIHPFTVLNVLSREGAWYYVDHAGYRGYVSVQYVEPIAWADNDYDKGWTERYSEDLEFDGNRSHIFTIMPVDYMKGAYWRFGGQAVESVATIGQNGCHLRKNMDRRDKSMILATLQQGTEIYVRCLFLDESGYPWYYVLYEDKEGFIHAVNVVLGEPDEPKD